jgi:hypothetical protein
MHFEQERCIEHHNVSVDAHLFSKMGSSEYSTVIATLQNRSLIPCASLNMFLRVLYQHHIVLLFQVYTPAHRCYDRTWCWDGVSESPSPPFTLGSIWNEVHIGSFTNDSRSRLKLYVRKYAFDFWV